MAGIAIGTAFAATLAVLLVEAMFKALIHAGPAIAETETAGIRNIGLVLAALLGAPFVIWRSAVAAKQAKIAEDGLLTDRINQAVQALGTDKTVSRHLTDDDGNPLYHDKEGSKEDPDFKRPVIVDTTEANLEVRTGAILALERLARQNPEFHVQIMEILCAYIRENAPARDARDMPKLIDSPDDLPAEDRTGKDGTPIPLHQQWQTIRKRNEETLTTWTAGLPPTRTDIMTALQVISRRNAKQRRIEAEYGEGRGDYVFDATLPEFRDGDDTAAYRKKAEAYRKKLRTYSGYRPDLRNTNLQGANLSRFDLRGIRFEGARMQGAGLVKARMQGARLWAAQMQGAGLWGAEMDEDTDLTAATLRGAAVRSVDDTTLAQLRPFWGDIFADGTVQVPDGERPTHWEDDKLDPDEFDEKWRAWQATLPPGWDRSD